MPPPAPPEDRPSPTPDASPAGAFELSIVVPAHNEADNLPRLIREIEQKVRGTGVEAELIVVDDGSTDPTWDRLVGLASEHPWLYAIRLTENRGQSLAMGIGVRHARSAVVATIDADLQNDPADLPAMFKALQDQQVDFVQGYRAHRKDTWSKRQASRIGRTARRWILADPVRDTGCSTRVVRADFARQWPLHFHGMHRFLPAYAVMLGARIHEVPVNHRAREVGVSHYSSLQRGAVGFFDLLAMRWMLARYRNTPPTQTYPPHPSDDAHPADAPDTAENVTDPAA